VVRSERMVSDGGSIWPKESQARAFVASLAQGRHPPALRLRVSNQFRNLGGCLKPPGCSPEDIWVREGVVHREPFYGHAQTACCGYVFRITSYPFTMNVPPPTREGARSNTVTWPGTKSIFSRIVQELVTGLNKSPPYCICCG